MQKRTVIGNIPLPPPLSIGLNPSGSSKIAPKTNRFDIKNTYSPGITNKGFISAVFPQLPNGASVAVCSKTGDPTNGGWSADRADTADLRPNHNNYVSCSSFNPGEDGEFKARKAQFAACHFLMLDDLGSKVSMEKLGDFNLSCLIETSPGNHQGLILFKEPITDGVVVEQLLEAIIAAGLCDAGSSGPLTRWARLPVGINGKERYKDEKGNPFHCRLVKWLPSKRYTPEEIMAGLHLELPPKKKVTTDGVLTPRADENPVITALKRRGLYKTPLGSGKHDITCPWVKEHTDGKDDGAAYFEPDRIYPKGGFRCHHSHGAKYHIGELLAHLEIPSSEAQHKPVLRIIPGELNCIVDAAEHELAKQGRYFQAGGLIVSVATDSATGDPSILPISSSDLTRRLSEATIWEQQKKGNWVRCDPPARHISILYDSREYQHLLPLVGVARQPYFRESDDKLIMVPGYDKKSKIFGVFDPQQYEIPSDLTKETARAAMDLLEDLLTEFHFVSPADKAAALSAMFTATVRPTLSYAPAYHVRAPVFGSGKTYLCELIGAFAGPGRNSKVSYPRTSDEATKSILSLLLTNPAVIEFDDMDSDWTPHGVIMRMITAEQITDRILGRSKTATVSTRTLFLGSGNNVGPIRDLSRRVLTIHVDPRTATPATMSYKKNPLPKVRQQRARYVAAVLTIILSWRECGSPQTKGENIVTFDGAWSQYCRQPLMWLGHPDPATALLNQVKHDPDAEAIGRLMSEWYRVFGSSPTTLRKAIETAFSEEDLLDAFKEFPIEERGNINRSKLGWILKKNANRIVNGFEFQKTKADGRNAWRVIKELPMETQA